MPTSLGSRCWPTWLAWRSNALHARRAEQIPTKGRMAYRAVAHDIDERGLAGPQCTFEGRAKLLRPLDVLTVTIHELEHSVVALVRQYLERIGPPLQEWQDR